MKKSGIKITSLAIAALMALNGPVAITEAYAAENPNNEITYDISYVMDESQVSFEDPYDEVKMHSYETADDSQVVDLPDFARSQVHDYLSKGRNEDITVGDLRSLTRLFLVGYDENADLSWLNYCTNLEYLSVTGDVIKQLDGVLSLPNVKTVSISTMLVGMVDLGKCGFLKHCPNLETLDINGECNPEYLYQLDGYVKNMSIDTEDCQSIDYRRLAFLDTLELKGGVYDVAINLSNEDIELLQNMGVKIEFSQLDKVTLEQVQEVNKKLDEIIKSLDIDENATREEKINAVLVYVISNLEYDTEVQGLIEEGQRRSIDYNKFYKDGSLYGALEGDSQICGNYAALTQALLHRLDVPTFVLMSENHAWNLVEVDGEYYYYDSTWLDGQSVTVQHVKSEKTDFGYRDTYTFELMNADEIILSGDPALISELIWYKVNPADYASNPDYYNGSHPESHLSVDFPISIVEVKTEIPSNTPSVTTEENVEENSVQSVEEENAVVEKEDVVEEEVVTPKEESAEENKEQIPITQESSPKVDKSFGEKLYDITIGNKTFRITGTVLLSIMSSLGVAVCVHKKREEKRLRERRRKAEEAAMFGGYRPLASPYDSSYSSGYSSFGSSSWGTSDDESPFTRGY